MQLNITFLIQIINFFITYWFLNKFMFKPVIKFLMNKNKVKNKMLHSISDKKELILNIENNKINSLQMFKKKIKKEYQLYIVDKPDLPEKIHFTIDKNENKKLINIAEKILFKKVPHVD